jgi:hypothetical protein
VNHKLWQCSLLGLLVVAGCQSANAPEDGQERAMSEAQPIHYELSRTGWRVTVTCPPQGPLHLEAADLMAPPPDGPVEPIALDIKLDDQTRQTFEALVARVGSNRPVEPGADSTIVCRLRTEPWEAAWTAESLEQHVAGAKLRAFMESQCLLRWHASLLASIRASRFQADNQLEEQAHALRDAIERLGTWWKPDKPMRDETGARYSDGKAALSRGDFAHAVTRFQRVLKMRRDIYKKKYAEAAAAGPAGLK